MNKWSGLLLTALGLAASVGTAQAELAAVDPGPYTFSTGKFPLWYQDRNNLSLELCQSKAVSPAVPGAPGAPGAPSYLCTLVPEPGVFDDTLPMVFPDNWPSELFWFLAETSIPDRNGYELEIYTAGVEAAFAGGQPLDGDQQSFARIRIRASVPVAGTYTITHPYGVETVNVTNPGRRAINITRDIGIGATGDFSGALAGDIGPFLTSASGRVSAVNPETGVTETFIGDPNVPGPVVGSPFNTNYVEITGPAGTIRSADFTVSGKVLDSRPPTPVEIERTSYRRTSDSTRIEVFANSTALNSTVCYRETLALVAGTPPSPCLVNLISDNNGYFFGNSTTQALPPFVVVTASDPSGTTKPTALSGKLTDVVKINTARYSWDTRTLTIEAVSSDETLVPDLAAEGFGRLTKNGITQTLSVADLPQPPAAITVKSSAGGLDREPVTVVGKAPEVGPNQLPLAVNDVASTSAGVPVTIPVLENDSDPDNDLPLSVVEPVLQAGALGRIALSGSTSVIYTPPATTPAAGLTETFTYRVQDARGGRSEPATVTVTVRANQAPVAANDTAAGIGNGTPVAINVLANDTDPDGNVPLAIANLTQPAAGRGTVAITGTALTYTPPTGVTTAFTATFTYQAQDTLGALSNTATVSVSVSPAVVENLSIQSATVTEKSKNRWTWEVRGRTNVVPGNSIQLMADTTAGNVVLGTVTPNGNGSWRFALNNSTDRVPLPGGAVTARSANGTEAIQSLSINRR